MTKIETDMPQIENDMTKIETHMTKNITGMTKIETDMTKIETGMSISFSIQFNVPFKIISLIETSQSIGEAKREYLGKTT